MTDISKCSGENEEGTCPLRETCKRYKAQAGINQSWLCAPHKEGHCEMYWEEK